MSSRRSPSGLASALLLALAGCSAAGETARATGDPAQVDDPAGAIELAVSQSCLGGSDPPCMAAGDQYVREPAEFLRAGVLTARAAGREGGPEVLEVTFDDSGARVLRAMTAEVAQDGPDARLVMKVGDSVLSAVAAPAPVDGRRARIALPHDLRAQEVVAMIEAAA